MAPLTEDQNLPGPTLPRLMNRRPISQNDIQYSHFKEFSFTHRQTFPYCERKHWGESKKCPKKTVRVGTAVPGKFR
jgi:hypothetical protein